MYLKENITATVLPDLGLKLRFAAIDLAPNEQLETGFATVDRERNLVRMDKIYSDKEILSVVENLGPASGTIVVIDMPKSLSIPGKIVQEEVKMHPLRLKRASGKMLDRYEARGYKLYDTIDKMGIMVLLYFNYWTRVNYDMLLPYRSRSPQGCRALQTALDYQLGVKNLPTNLAPSSVLEAIVGAYASWSIWAGTPDEDYEIYQDDEGHRLLIAKNRPHLRQPKQRTFRRRRR